MTSDFSIAVHALVYLGKNQDLISSDELAKHICTHPVRVRRVMIKLREAGLIKAKAGVDGGYRLDKEADNITLSEIAKSVSNDYTLKSKKYSGGFMEEKPLRTLK